MYCRLAPGGVLLTALTLLPCLSGAPTLEAQSSPLRATQLSQDQLRSLDISELQVPPGPIQVTDPALLERLVRLAYGRLGMMVRETGYDLHFDIDQVRHYYTEDFDEVFWLDIVDLPEGEVVDITRERFVERTPDSATETLRYHAKWAYHEPELHFPLDRLHAATRTVHDVLVEAQQMPGFRPWTAVTAYRVTVHLDGKEKTYKAHFGWTEPLESETPVVISDLIVNGVELGLSGAPTGTRELPAAKRLLEPAPEPQPTEGEEEGGSVVPLAAATTWCKHADPSVDWTLMYQKGTDDHLTGVEAHVATAEAGIDCLCQPNCDATCQSSIRYDRCYDDGGPFISTLTACHKPSPASIDGEMVTQRDSASCTSGIGCAFKACLGICACNASISISAGHGNVSIASFSGDWSIVQKRTGSCYCETIEITGPPGSDPQPIPCDCCKPEICTPIVIDVDGNGFRFTDVLAGVYFDLGGDGSVEQVAWTEEDSDDAFLVLDRNEDGLINDGRELFGSVAAQPVSDDPNGYIALAVFDGPEMAGDGDGWITANDGIFILLRLWKDANHDGIAQAEELESLTDAGIQAIGLDHVLSRRRDRYGNLLRWVGKVKKDGPARFRSTDVALLTSDLTQ